MADANKNPEVDIDLDDVKETEVKIEETLKEESKEPNLNVGEVDLGYADHSKDKPKEEVNVQEIPEEQPAQSEPSQRAKDWASKNAWFGNDKIMTNAAMTVHEDLVGMGIDVESDEYYNEIDKRMKDNFPHRFANTEQRKPVQKVASAGRTQQGRRSVRLTKSQVAIAKKLGVPLEEYAKFVKEV